MQLISFAPSNWLRSPWMVDWRDNGGIREKIPVRNYWKREQAAEALRSVESPLASWKSLETRTRTRCAGLTFSDDAFQPLGDQPFVRAVADQFMFLFEQLNCFADCFDAHGKRSEEGNQLYRDFFTGDRTRFSDSSEDEKRRFENELTFPRPEKTTESLFCPMHGKTQTPQLRFHFSWPIRYAQPVYVVYVGPKLTKR